MSISLLVVEDQVNLHPNPALERKTFIDQVIRYSVVKDFVRGSTALPKNVCVSR